LWRPALEGGAASRALRGSTRLTGPHPPQAALLAAHSPVMQTQHCLPMGLVCYASTCVSLTLHALTLEIAPWRP